MRAALCLLLAAGISAAAAPTADRPPSRRQIAALQIALDNAGFSPGPIDGRIGPRHRHALRLARAAGLDPQPLAEPWKEWTAPVGFLEGIGPVPESWLARSKLKATPHQTPRERFAEKFHLSEGFAAYLNRALTNAFAFAEGDVLQAPALVPTKLPKADRLEISLSDKTVTAFDTTGKLLAAFPCSIAAKKEKRPVGALLVKVIAPNPDYCFDPALFPEVPEATAIKSKLMIPPGPNNPVGEMWIGLDRPGYGLHGTPWPEEIGKTSSHGCFRLTNWDARRLAALVKIGTPVFVKE
ncbi:MAG: L,D-transpeptidase family protein [Verrucomicrobiae bacterium]|nr:L,D-transpeptidase family protein [Verrucomicrobiae bacterium]